MQGLALFDFDGTITSKDSLLEFIKYTSGKFGFLLVMSVFSPLIFYYIFIKKDGEIAKRKVLAFLFKGKTKDELNQLGVSFASDIIPTILLPKAVEEIKNHKNRGDRVIIISASLENWLKPWAESMDIELICTQMEFDEGKFTGRFATPNCNGEEKVNRIKAYLNVEKFSPVFAYGNSSGDKAMLALADHGFYRHFN
jgi:HAD superfamily hydrolase (TIGR01490 family)